jgi:hypothetical protein
MSNCLTGWLASYRCGDDGVNTSFHVSTIFALYGTDYHGVLSNCFYQLHESMLLLATDVLVAMHAVHGRMRVGIERES